MVLFYDSTGKYGHAKNYLLLSRKKPTRVLYIFGSKKPSRDEFLKEEKRIQYFKRFGSGPVKVNTYYRKKPRRKK